MREIRLVLLLCFLGIEVFANGLYGNYLQHEGSKWALAELEKNSEYLGSNPIVDRFYVNTFNSNIRRFNDIEQLVSRFNAPTPEEATQREGIYNDIEDIEEQINTLDLVYPNLSESQQVQNMQQRAILTQQRFAKFQVLVTMQETIKNRTESLVLEAEDINYYIAPEGVYETNEKKINALYFKTLARGNTQFSETDKAVINAMAPLCPKIAGKGVYLARFLQNIYDNITYTDEGNCSLPSSGGGIASKMIKANETAINLYDFKVFPNPTRDILFVEIANSLQYDVIIRDITGRIVSQNKATNNIEIPVSDFTDGLYFCEFWQNRHYEQITH